MKFKRMMLTLLIATSVFLNRATGNELGLSTGMNSTVIHIPDSQKRNWSACSCTPSPVGDGVRGEELKE